MDEPERCRTEDSSHSNNTNKNKGSELFFPLFLLVVFSVLRLVVSHNLNQYSSFENENFHCRKPLNEGQIRYIK